MWRIGLVSVPRTHGDICRHATAPFDQALAVIIVLVRLNPRKISLGASAMAVVVLFGGAAVWGVQEFVSSDGDQTIVMAALDAPNSSELNGSVNIALDAAVGLENKEEGNQASGAAQRDLSADAMDSSADLRAAIEAGAPTDLEGLFLHNSEIDPFVWRPDPRSCDGLERGVVVDRETQRGWYCLNSAVDTFFVLTSSDLQPDPGEYSVYAKDLKAWSWEFGPPSTMTHFVAFTRGKFKGARIAFHSVPKYSDGSWAQPLDSVGTLDRFGDSSGCIRLLPEDAVALWDFLDIGGTVRVIS
jgi:hypothetical protein